MSQQWRHRAGIVLRWPIGMGLASWRYLWRTTPMHRRDEVGLDERAMPSVPVEPADAALQPASAGVGPLYRRRYWVHVENPKMTAEQVMAAIAEQPNRLVPAEVAVFDRKADAHGALQPGDELVVRMPGPWDGPVRVLSASPTSLRLVTLRGHLEAGQIEFRATPEQSGFRFEIESWTRSGDRLSSWLYNRARVVKEMQLHMWTHCCERVAKLAQGRLRDGVHVDTTRSADSRPG